MMTGKHGMGRLMLVLCASAILTTTVVPGCVGHGLLVSGYRIRGEIQDAATGEALEGGIRVDVVVKSGNVSWEDGPFATDPTGAIELFVWFDSISAHFLWPGIPVSDAKPPPPPVPDRVTLRIGEGDGLVEVVIELTEEMGGELDESGSRTIELGTILVPGGDA